MNTTNRAKHYQKMEDESLLALIKGILAERPTYGYRRVSVLLNANLQIE